MAAHLARDVATFRRLRLYRNSMPRGIFGPRRGHGGDDDGRLLSLELVHRPDADAGGHWPVTFDRPRQRRGRPRSWRTPAAPRATQCHQGHWLPTTARRGALPRCCPNTSTDNASPASSSFLWASLTLAPVSLAALRTASRRFRKGAAQGRRKPASVRHTLSRGSSQRRQIVPSLTTEDALERASQSRAHRVR